MSQIKLTADSGGGTTSLKAPSSTTSNADVVLKLPVADGSANQVLKTDGSGQLSFTSNAGTTINNNADNRIITGSGTASTLNGEANLTFDGTILEISNATPKLKLTDSDATGTPEAIVDGSGGDLILHVDKDNEKGSSLFAVEIDGSEKIRIDSSGRVMIGTTSTSGISSNGDDLIIGSIGDSTDRGITLATTTSGSIRWADAGDNAMGRIQYLNNSDVMTFHTSNATRLRLDSDGMKFGSDSAAANALDDYEEGTFTPTVTGNSGSLTLSNASGTYTKIGNVVYFSYYIQASSGSTGTFPKLGGLPFAMVDDSNKQSFITAKDKVGVSYSSSDYSNMYFRMDTNATTATGIAEKIDGSTHTGSVLDVSGSGARLRGSGFYFV